MLFVPYAQINVITVQKIIIQRLRHSSNCSDTELYNHEALQQKATDELADHKKLLRKLLSIDISLLRNVNKIGKP